MVPRRKFYGFYVRAAIDRDTMEWSTKFPRSKPCVCGFSLLNPSVAYAGEDEENCLYVAILVAIKVKCFS